MRDTRKETFLARMAERYCWDARVQDALADEPRIIRRVVGLGLIGDLLEMERVVDRGTLVTTVQNAPPGSLRPRSWAFWHFGLQLTAPGDRPPPMPTRRFA